MYVCFLIKPYFFSNKKRFLIFLYVDNNKTMKKVCFFVSFLRQIVLL